MKNCYFMLLLFSVLILSCTIHNDEPFNKIEGKLVLQAQNTELTPVTEPGVNPSISEIIKTGLPILYINTEENQAIESKTTYVNSKLSLKSENPDYCIEEIEIEIAGRGNTTFYTPKMPYKFKVKNGTDGKKKQSFFDFESGKQKSWILLANYYDESLMRNDIAFWLSKNANMPWTPNGQFVELVLNGEHKGNYYLCDAIKIDKKRINLQGETQFMMEIDVRQDEDVYFDSNQGLPYMIKEPDSDKYKLDQLEELKTYINETLEPFLYSEDIITADDSKFAEIGLDVDSFIRWWFVNEIMGNYDTLIVGRHVTYECKDGKVSFKMQPVWDFDFSCYEKYPAWENVDMYHCWYLKDSTYYPQLLKNQYFVEQVKTIWNNDFYPLQTELYNYIEETRRYIKESALLDRKLYPGNKEVINTGIKRNDFDAYVDHNKKFLNERFTWLNIEINNLSVSE